MPDPIPAEATVINGIPADRWGVWCPHNHRIRRLRTLYTKRVRALST